MCDALQELEKNVSVERPFNLQDDLAKYTNLSLFHLLFDDPNLPQFLVGDDDDIRQ